MLTPHTSRPTAHAPAHASNGGRLVSTDGRALPLVGTSLAVDAAGGIARVTVEQRFRNVHAEPLAVTYSLPLPSDGAVSGFSFRIGAERTVGEIDKRRAARERYEAALVEGKSAALLEQDRSSLFTQEIGNIPPGEEVVVEVSVDQRLRWLDEGAWEWRFPTVAAPRYLGEDGRVPDAARVTQDVSDGPIAARVTIACSIRDALPSGRAPESPSHRLAAKPGEGATRVELADAKGARLDRDVVVRWSVATPKVGVSLETGRAPDARAASRHAHGLLTLVPPAASPDRPRSSVARDLIVLLDTSGSMSGEPLDQAVRVTTAMIETLGDRDRLELISFGSAPTRWKKEPVFAAAANRAAAVAWLRALRASGGTEMRAGILEALSGLRADAQRQVVLVTDGLIGFEQQVVAAIAERLPASSRVHTVGVGSSVNRSLTGPAARAGHGVEVILGIGEDPERAASRLVARTAEPIVVDLAIEGSALVEHAPAKLPDLFAGAPALVALALAPDGGDLCVRGRTREGTWERRVKVPPRAAGEGNPAVAALFGREAVEDLEARIAAGGDAREIDAIIEKIGLAHQIATRLTSWVAVSERRTVDPDDALRRERMPHELPYGMSAEGLGLRRAMPPELAELASRMMAGERVRGVYGGRIELGSAHPRGKAMAYAGAPPPPASYAPAAPPPPAPAAPPPPPRLAGRTSPPASMAPPPPPPVALEAAPPASMASPSPGSRMQPSSSDADEPRYAPLSAAPQALPAKPRRARWFGYLVALLVVLAIVALILLLLQR